MAAKLDVDEIWRGIGFGRYQGLRIYLWLYGCFVACTHIVTIVFLGKIHKVCI